MIKYNTWYLINKEDKQKFLEEVALLTSPSPINVDDEIYNAECLYLSNEPFKLKYRTTYRPDYMPNIKIYEPKTKGELKLMECKNCKDDRLINMVNNFYQELAADITAKCRENIKTIKADSAIGQAAAKLEKAIEQTGRKYQIIDILPTDLYDKLTLNNIEEEEAECHKALNELGKTNDMAIALITSCDTYQEKLDVLKKFKIFSLE